MSDTKKFLLDGKPVVFQDGQTILEAARQAGHYIPHLCWHPDFPAHGSCKLCIVKVGGRHVSSCAMPAKEGMEVESNTPEMNGERRALLQMLFVEGNHFCPSCEKSGNCQLQALAYDLEMLSAHFNHFYPNRPVDASHPDVLLDFNRCIFCELCVRASRDIDGKNIFALTDRGIHKHLVVNAESGRLADTDFAASDRAANICPVGVILHKRQGFARPIGERDYDAKPISVVAMEEVEK
ncbi:MAG: (2Fe-2S)-binding protein [Azospira sp.]|jgi:[NiFe] hydrogenase diaphorase moiety small subunit|uniref:NADH:ubiquinone oxidoreductase chain G-like protein n=2 Tax=Azospira oryzae TaxID=146939 RepID=G8QHH1_AZOOP|nr:MULTISPECIES: 2Fe-2S iron-sulfur cluster-binding protein [Azospira]MBP7489009.1 (2Fe-2S)-binding protein [Azospira sp.]TLS18073.1 MAG: 2Fe-2S iron-sulfur cluster binding domain-containing protein [Betaproteobacteria bacterium]AEV27364.1 NADH:ubiquinone oxidoreductase chain G-like protein [Azospira oryzae PS]RZT90232.1 [NiFe] hydrogenase diaphorase moiety small subunit [Azospira oryzae]BBN87298.1 hydrogenase HoxU [Azospira sp. I09]